MNPERHTTVIRPERGHRRGRFLLRWLMFCGVAIGGFASLTIALASAGMVVGEEFSPDLFARRSFVYFRLPLLGVQISPVRRRDTTNSLEKHLNKAGLIPKTEGLSPQWDIVVVSRAGVPRWTGNSYILCNYLDQSNATGESRWLNWSKENVESAEVLWPMIAELARQQLYYLCPDLLELASVADDPSQLRSQLQCALGRELLWVAHRQRLLGQHATAVALYSRAADLPCSLPEVFRGRALSYRALGKVEEAAADLQRARELRDPAKQ
jgi:hypothetical protein